MSLGSGRSPYRPVRFRLLSLHGCIQVHVTDLRRRRAARPPRCIRPHSIWVGRDRGLRLTACPWRAEPSSLRRRAVVMRWVWCARGCCGSRAGLRPRPSGPMAIVVDLLHSYGRLVCFIAALWACTTSIVRGEFPTGTQGSRSATKRAAYAGFSLNRMPAARGYLPGSLDPACTKLVNFRVCLVLPPHPDSEFVP